MNVGAAAAASAGALVCGTATALTPVAAALPLAAVVAMLVVVSPWFRAALVVGGGLITLGPAELTAAKMVYFAGLAFVLAVSTYRVSRLYRFLPREWRLALLASATFAVYLVFTFVVAFSNGVAVLPWLRDVMSYFLLASAVVVAIDLGLHASARAAQSLLLAAGLVGAISTAVSWTAMRGVSTLGLERVGLSSLGMAAAGIATGAALALSGHRPRLGYLVFFIALAAMLLPGSRTNLLLLVGLLPLAGATQLGCWSYRRFVRVIAAGTIAAGVTLYAASQVFLNRSDFLQARLDAMLNVLRNGVSTDASGSARQYAYEFVAARWNESPWLGLGPGTSYRSHTGAEQTTLDTPLMTLARLGIVGTVVLLLLVAATAWTVRRAAAPGRIAWPIMRSFLLVQFLALPFGGIDDDKGTAFALILIVGLSLAERGGGAVLLHPSSSHADVSSSAQDHLGFRRREDGEAVGTSSPDRSMAHQHSAG